MSRHQYECQTCGQQWPSEGYAIDCAEQDALEAEDRANGNFFRSNRN